MVNEFGPRALGNRSILTSISSKYEDVLNLRVKKESHLDHSLRSFREIC